MKTKNTVSSRNLLPVKSVVFAAGDSINETIRIRDKHQVEIRLHYPVRKDKALSKYHLECYIFLPGSLGVHRMNLSKDKFYDDLYTEIRLKTPRVSLLQLAEGQDNPLQKLQDAMAMLSSASTQEHVQAFEHQLKLFCCIAQNSLKSFVESLKEDSQFDTFRAGLEQYFRSSLKICESFRALKPELEAQKPSQKIMDIYHFGDEYLSLLVERSACEILEELAKWNDVESEKERVKLIRMAAQELSYRVACQYSSVPVDDNNERLLYRRSMLKKYMHSVLTLDTQKKREGKLVEHLLFALAGGLAMLFATIMLFISQSIYGSLTIPVLTTLVVSYMFKDRIKEILRVYFSSIQSIYLYDHKTRIYRFSKTLIGLCRESFDYVSEKKLPRDVLEIRHRDYLPEIESDWVRESILRYRKQVKFFSKKLDASYHDLDLRDINDIIRFDLSDFTRRMGFPDEEVYVFDKDSYQKTRSQRVYHINMVLCYNSGNGETFYKRLRIVLNRRNIKRVETV